MLNLIIIRSNWTYNIEPSLATKVDLGPNFAA